MAASKLMLSMLATAAAAPVAKPIAPQAATESLSVAGQCFLAMIVLYFAAELMLYIVNEKAKWNLNTPASMAQFDSFFNEEKLNAAKSAMPLIPVLSVLMLFIMFRASSLDQSLSADNENLPSLSMIQMGYILSVVGIYFQALNAFGLGFGKEPFTTASFGLPFMYVGYAIIVYGVMYYRDTEKELSAAAGALLTLSATMFILQAMIKFMQAKGLDLIKNNIAKVPIPGADKAADLVGQATTPTGEVAPPPSEETSLLASTPQKTEDMPSKEELMAGPDFKALHPGNLFNEAKLVSALSTTGLIPTYMLLCFFMHFRLQEGGGQQGALDDQLDNINLAMTLGAWGIVAQVFSVLIIKSLHSASGTVVRSLGLLVSYAAYLVLGYAVYNIKPIENPALLSGVALIAAIVLMQAIAFFIDEYQARFTAGSEYLTLVQKIIADLLATTGYASMIAIVCFYMYFKSKMDTLEIPDEALAAMLMAAASIFAQMFFVLLDLFREKMPEMATKALVGIKMLVIFAMYAAMAMMVFYAVTLAPATKA
jgi:hypothetical protein